MDLRSPFPYWLIRHGIVNSYPSLPASTRADIVIMGAGISGALLAWEMTQAGYDVVVVDRRHAGSGSTAASTALLQYELDVPLHRLVEKIGEKPAIRSYELCREAIKRLGTIARQLKEPGIFRPRPSFQFASYKKHVSALEKEYRLRKAVGIPLQWLDQREVKAKFGFDRPAGILSEEGAEADAYRITHGLLKAVGDKGARVFDKTNIVRIRHHPRSVELLTEERYSIRARFLLIACGYESQRYLPRHVEQLKSTYAIASEPFATTDFWYRDAMIWETAVPYLYLRATDDRRILIGGKDRLFTSALHRDAVLHMKAKSLEKSARQLFPAIPFKTDFMWAGTFSSTKDGLPFIGGVPQRPHTFFSLGFGGNGIAFSVVAASLIKDMLAGKRNKDSGLFAFDR